MSKKPELNLSQAHLATAYAERWRAMYDNVTFLVPAIERGNPKVARAYQAATLAYLSPRAVIGSEYASEAMSQAPLEGAQQAEPTSDAEVIGDAPIISLSGMIKGIHLRDNDSFEEAA
jgi:hypothetical protein